jgi:hypothetical protein
MIGLALGATADLASMRRLGGGRTPDAPPRAPESPTPRPEAPEAPQRLQGSRFEDWDAPAARGDAPTAEAPREPATEGPRRLRGPERSEVEGLSPEGRERLRGELDRVPDEAPEVGPSRLTEGEAPPKDAEEMVDRWFNLDKYGLSEEGEQIFRQEAARVIQEDPSLLNKRVVSWEEQKATAERLGLSSANLAGGEGRLEGPEFLAAASMLTKNNERAAALLRRRADPRLTPDELKRVDQELGQVEQINDRLLERVAKERTQRGRDLNSLKILANLDLDPVLWLSRARSYAGNRPLTTTEVTKIRELVNRARERPGRERRADPGAGPDEGVEDRREGVDGLACAPPDRRPDHEHQHHGQRDSRGAAERTGPGGSGLGLPDLEGAGHGPLVDGGPRVRGRRRARGAARTPGRGRDGRAPSGPGRACGAGRRRAKR